MKVAIQTSQMARGVMGGIDAFRKAFTHFETTPLCQILNQNGIVWKFSRGIEVMLEAEVTEEQYVLLKMALDSNSFMWKL